MVRAFCFNPKPLTLGKSFAAPKPEDFPNVCYKNSPYAFVVENSTPYVQEILQAAPITHTRQYCAVDIKVHNIEKGKYACIPGWHCDTVIDPYHETEGEIHHIFVSGQAALTEFIAEPISLEISEKKQGRILLHNLQQQLTTKNLKIVSIPSCQFVTYGRWDFHRAAKGLFPEKRLLIRVTETDVIRPSVQRIICQNYE